MVGFKKRIQKIKWIAWLRRQFWAWNHYNPLGVKAKNTQSNLNSLYKRDLMPKQTLNRCVRHFSLAKNIYIMHHL
jgi:hypothetical protein